MDKYKDMTKGELLIELEETLVELERIKKEKENIEHINSRLNYKINVLKETIKQIVDRI